MVVLLIALRTPGLVFFRARRETPWHSPEHFKGRLSVPSFPRLAYSMLTYCVQLCTPCSVLSRGMRGGHFPYPRQIQFTLFDFSGLQASGECYLRMVIPALWLSIPKQSPAAA